MSSLVLVDTQSGSLTRIETGGSTYRKSHYAVPNEGPTFLSANLVEQFRLYPDPAFSLDPPPRPTLPPTGGTSASFLSLLTQALGTINPPPSVA